MTAQQHESWRVLILCGELDLCTAALLEGHLWPALTAATPPRVALELSGLTFCDSAGLDAIQRGWRRTCRLGGELLLLAPTPRLVELLRITALDRYLDIAAALPSPTAQDHQSSP